MADITDTNNFRGRLDAEWENLDQVDIDDPDRTAIRYLVEHRRDSEERAIPILGNDLSNLGRISISFLRSTELL